MQAEELIRELPKGLIKWYNFQGGGKALCVTNHGELQELMADGLEDGGLLVERVPLQKLEQGGGSALSGGFHYVVLAGVLECAKDPARVLRIIREGMAGDGKLFLCMDNRLGIRYFCGDRDPFTERNFDGIENYRRISRIDQSEPEGRNYAKAEITAMLDQAGFLHHRFYSVFPEILCPQILFAEDYLPAEELNIRIFPQYHYRDTVFLEEENLYTSLIQNGLFHGMANGFLVECPLDASFANARQITISMDRGRENALCTVIRRDGRVEKRAVYGEGRAKLGRLAQNNAYLREHGVPMVDGRLEGGAFVMPYVDAKPLIAYFRELLMTDVPLLLEGLDSYWELVLGSSEHVPYEEIDWERFEPWWEKRKADDPDRGKWRRVAFGTAKEQEALGPILKRGYIDLVSLNGFYTEEGFLFYDQELYVDNLPAKVLLLRTIDFIYYYDDRLQKIYPREELLKRYRLEMYQDLFYSFVGYFLDRLRNDRLMSAYYVGRRRDDETTHCNRQHMNYSAEEYQRLFVDIFSNMENRKLYLFGSGNFTKKFLALYKEEYEIAGILDNSSQKQGGRMEGIPILPPSVLESLDPSTYKVIICIKNYTKVLKQVKGLGATNIGIYETSMEYPRKQKQPERVLQDDGQVPKKYHVGYVAGVFDLFHIGHLNLLRRAKEQCDYLIVGVVTDEGVRKNKRTEAFIPFEERLEVVRSCRYVDEAVGIPLEFCDTRDAYLKFQFDAQFSGSDYAGDPEWEKKREFLRRHGAELVFFPYTESTSSTKIKSMINQRLL